MRVYVSNTKSYHLATSVLSPYRADARVFTTNADDRVYELSNHLGNVLATFTARKLPLTEAGAVVGFAPHLTSLSDYYPFGSGMEGRTVTEGYRYSFQGQETDAEYFNGAVSFKYRVHDARLGRFLSVDPLSYKYVYNSVYAFQENKTGLGVELEGLELLEQRPSSNPNQDESNSHPIPTILFTGPPAPERTSSEPVIVFNTEVKVTIGLQATADVKFLGLRLAEDINFGNLDIIALERSISSESGDSGINFNYVGEDGEYNGTNSIGGGMGLGGQSFVNEYSRSRQGETETAFSQTSFGIAQVSLSDPTKSIVHVRIEVVVGAEVALGLGISSYTTMGYYRTYDRNEDETIPKAGVDFIGRVISDFNSTMRDNYGM